MSDDKINAGLAYFTTKAANAGADLLKIIDETIANWLGAADDLALEGAGGVGKTQIAKVEESPNLLKIKTTVEGANGDINCTAHALAADATLKGNPSSPLGDSYFTQSQILGYDLTAWDSYLGYLVKQFGNAIFEKEAKLMDISNFLQKETGNTFIAVVFPKGSKSATLGHTFNFHKSGSKIYLIDRQILGSKELDITDLKNGRELSGYLKKIGAPDYYRIFKTN